MKNILQRFNTRAAGIRDRLGRRCREEQGTKMFLQRLPSSASVVRGCPNCFEGEGINCEKHLATFHPRSIPRKRIPSVHRACA